MFSTLVSDPGHCSQPNYYRTPSGHRRSFEKSEWGRSS